MITPSFTCQNSNHAHHPIHFQSSYRLVDTVVEESTGGSVVTVISNTTTSNDITESDMKPNIDDTLSTATQSLSIKSKLIKDDASNPAPSTSLELNEHNDSDNVDTISNDIEMGTEIIKIMSKKKTKQKFNFIRKKLQTKYPLLCQFQRVSMLIE